jgi:hypothetical protein
MTLDAVSPQYAVQAALHVLLAGDRLKMLGVDAGGVPAEMIQMEAGWDLANQQLVRDAVSELGLTLGGSVALAAANLAVAGWSAISQPVPAAILRLVDHGPEVAGGPVHDRRP